MELRMRPMMTADRPSVVKMLDSVSEFTRADLAIAREVIDAYLSRGAESGYHAWVAESGLSMCGYICFGPTPLTEGTWDIYWIAVDPQAQGRGVGRALLELAHGFVSDRNGRQVLVETSSRPDYARTRGFYEAAGYVLASRIPDFYAPGEDRLTYVHVLDGAARGG